MAKIQGELSWWISQGEIGAVILGGCCGGGGELFRGNCLGSKSPRGNRPKKISWEPVVLEEAGQGGDARIPVFT